MKNIEIRKITKEEFTGIIAGFKENSDGLNITVDEEDVLPLVRGSGLICVKMDSLTETAPLVNYDRAFMCCLIEAPESFSLDEVRKALNLFPADEKVFGFGTSSSLKIRYFFNDAE